MGEVESGHMAGGSRVSSIKTLFPSYMSSDEIQSYVRTAYRYSSKLRTQGDTVLVVGPGPIGTRMRIIMSVNKRTGTIETAYPYFK